VIVPELADALRSLQKEPEGPGPYKVAIKQSYRNEFDLLVATVAGEGALPREVPGLDVTYMGKRYRGEPAQVVFEASTPSGNVDIVQLLAEGASRHRPAGDRRLREQVVERPPPRRAQPGLIEALSEPLAGTVAGSATPLFPVLDGVLAHRVRGAQQARQVLDSRVLRMPGTAAPLSSCRPQAHT